MASTLNPPSAAPWPQAHAAHDAAWQVERTISALEQQTSSNSGSGNVSTPPSMAGLQALLQRVQRVVHDPTDRNRLTVRVQRLIRRSQSAALESSSASASTSAMGRFLEASIAQPVPSPSASTSSAVRLPPTPRFIVDANVSDARAERLAPPQDAEDEDDGLAEYEHASGIRQRRGHQHKGDDDGGGTEDGKAEKRDSSSKPTAAAAPPPSTTTTDRATHENLSSELLRMASALRSQSITFSEALERDRKLLESTDEHLAKNLDLMTRTRGRLGEYAHKARGMGWLTLGTIIVVVLIWVVMFVIIKLT